jgi:HEPN domain-containing protein
MTQRKHFPPDDPREWLGRARSFLTHAQVVAPGVDLEIPCFEAQQAAELSIKAVLLNRGIDFPFTHNLAKLMELLEVNGEFIPLEIKKADRLTRFAVETRYPGADPEPRPITTIRSQSPRPS